MRRLNWVLEIVLQCITFALCIQSEISNVVIPVKTNFSCLNKTAGFYADTGASCKIYHTCDEYGNKFTYHCPEETAFRQDALICDHAHLVRCQGHTIYNSKYIEEKNNKTFSLNVSSVKDLVEKSQNVYHITQSLKPFNKVQYGFTIGTKEYFGNLNKPKVAEPNITNVHIANDTSFTATFPINSFMKTTLQHVFSVNNTQERGEIKNDNFSIQKQIFNNWDKSNEKDRTNQKDLNRKTNDALYNFMKFSVNVFPGNAKNQEDNAKNYQSVKNITDLPTLPFIHHRNNPYLETLKSVQKNSQISATTNSIKKEHTLVVTTELPVYALTLSLQPLIPSELEYDPYYPKLSTSTELYYTPAHNKKLPYMKEPDQATWSSIHFELPPILPDLNSLEDIVDRRKLFYIPRITSN